MKVASFFAGIGGFDLGVERAGMEVIFQCEINTFCQKVLKKQWPDAALFSDIKTLRAADIPDEADLWCAGFPCQDLSLANQGKRKGLKGERSGLFHTFADLAAEKLPKWIILENVPGLLNSHEGKDFQILLETLDELGYGISWRVFDAKYFGTPQRRRRVYVVASFGDLSSSTILFGGETIEAVERAGLGKREIIAKSNGRSLPSSDEYLIQHACIGRKPEAGPQAKGYRNDGEAYTLDSRGSADAVCKTSDAFRVRNSARFSKRLDGNRYRAIGNAVCVHIVNWIAGRIMLHEASKKEARPELEAVI